MDEQEREEILWRLDERTKRVDENLERLHTRTRRNSEDIDQLQEVVGDHGTQLKIAQRALIGLGGLLSAAVAKLLTGMRLI